MIDWQDIKANPPPNDDGPKLFYMPNGYCIASGVADVSTKENAAIYRRSGDWPHVGWIATHWAKLEPPS